MLFESSEKKFVHVISQLIDCNPFRADRIELERKALGRSFKKDHAEWNLHPHEHRQTENVSQLHAKAEEIIANVTSRISGADEITDQDRLLHLDLVRFVMFDRFRDDFERLAANAKIDVGSSFDRFASEIRDFAPIESFPEWTEQQICHIFALLFQIRRAFNNVFRNMIGSSPAVIELRANVWQSIFTSDMRRFHAGLCFAMADFPCLITGPTGSGKELVAQAIGLSSYIPFDPVQKTFVGHASECFISLNLSALNPTIIESELFGHVKGAFTGATSDHIGWLDRCSQYGTVFLDEIGELDESIQVKLLRVLQERTFSPIGSTSQHRFEGRIVAATNRDIQEAIQAGRFRRDFFYRLCADRIHSPSLAERVVDGGQELRCLVDHLVSRMVTSDEESLAAEVCDWIESNLAGYAWPGNVRELEQCIRRWLIRKHYVPLEDQNAETKQSLESCLQNCELTADELLTLYANVKYRQTNSYQATARVLDLDRRTVKARVQADDAS